MADVEKAMSQEAGDIQPVPPPAYSPTYGTTQDTPPDYEQHHADTSAVVDTSAPPPSYDSIFGQVKAARAESSSHVDFFKKFLTIILSTIGCTIFIGIILAIPISMIAMGSVFLHDCPYERYIPIYLIVGGCFGIVKNLSNMMQRLRNKHEHRDDENTKTNPFDGTLNCFLFAWFIAGNVWIYRAYGKFSIDPASPDYCHPLLYAYAFWLTTATYILLAVTCCCVCITGCLCGRVTAVD